VDTRLSTVESDTQNQSAIAGTTTFNGGLNCSASISASAMYALNFDNLGSVAVGLGVNTNNVTYIGNASNPCLVNSSYLRANSFIKQSGTVNEILMANGSVATRTMSLSPAGDPLSQSGVSNFLGASYTVQSFYVSTSFKATNVNIYRNATTATVSQSIAIYNSSNVRIGVVTQSGLTTTTVSFTFSTPVQLTGDSYYYLAIQSAAQGGYYSGSTTGVAIINSGLNSNIQYIRVAFTGTSLPSTLPTTGGSTASFIYPPYTIVGYGF
jgi:hypothetical protein